MGIHCWFSIHESVLYRCIAKIQLHLLTYAQQQRCGHDHTPGPGPCTHHSAPAHFIAFIAFIAFADTLTTFMAFIAFIAFADTLTVFMAFIAFAFTLTAFIAFIARRIPFFIGGASSTAFFIAFAMMKGEREIEGYGHELKNQLEPKWLRVPFFIGGASS